MTDSSAVSGRLILAPHLWPRPPAESAPGPLFYLSWTGWEDYLARRLGLAAATGGPTPILLPDGPGPDLSLAALDHLVGQAGIQGAGLIWPLLAPEPPGLASLAEAIRRGSSAPPAEPLLSDRAYLALWTLAEYQIAQSEELLAEAARKERALWAALKGEAASDAPTPAGPAPAGPDRRAAYAWRCWRRLAEPFLAPGDRLLATAPRPEEEGG